MANSLIKNTVIVSVVGTEEVPAIPYRPATPGRTAYEMRNVCMFRYNGAGHYVFTTNPRTGQTTGTFIPDALNGGSGLQGTYSCQPQQVPVVYPGTPAQPYVPGYSITVVNRVTGYNLGWNAGARSAAVFWNDGYVEFKVRASVVGVICGINFSDGINSGYNGNTIDFAFYLARGQARVIRNGVIGAGIGAYTDATVFRIERTGTAVAFLRDGAEVFSVTSGVPVEPGWLEASLYSADDEVFDPKVVQISPPDTTAQTGQINAQLERLTMFAATGRYASLSAELPPLSMAATSGLVTPSYAVGDFMLPPLGASVDGLTGEIGSIDLTLEVPAMLAADHPYGEVEAALEPLTMDASALEGNFAASMSSLAFAHGEMAAATFLVVTMNSRGIVSAAMASDVMVSAEILSRAAMGSVFDVDALLDAVMVSIARSGTMLGVPESDCETWVVNLTSQGSTTYTNFAFNSFAKIGTRHYGACARGIVELAGATDDGQPIRSSIGLGELDFGVAVKKTVSHAYLGMSGEGDLFVKLIVDGDAYLYKTEGFSDRLRQQRVKFGKGLRANYAQVEIYNAHGHDFEVDTAEFHIADLTRRI